jgi:hypothetical protein
MELDPLQATNAKRQQRPFVHKPTELPLDGGTGGPRLTPARSRAILLGRHNPATSVIGCSLRLRSQPFEHPSVP